MVVALFCVVGALLAWFLLESTVACVAFSLGCACMAGLLACDVREHILPTEFVLAFLGCAVVFRLALGGVGELVAVGLPAAVVGASLLALNALRLRRGAAEIIGSGDVRMILPLALFSGTTGLASGLFACALTMGLMACAQLLMGKADRSSTLALAPALAAWLLFGTLL